MKTRDEIEEKYKWDLTCYIKNDEEIEEIFKEMESLPEQLSKYDGKLNSKDLLFERFNKYESIFQKVQKLAVYLANMQSVDAEDEKILKLQTRFNNIYSRISRADAFLMPQMYQLDDEYLLSLLDDERSKEFRHTIKDIIKNKPHKIDENTNKLLAKMNKFLGNNGDIHSILTDSEMKYEDAIDEDGNKHELNNETAIKFLQGKDKNLRKTAFEHRLNAYKDLNKTFTELYLKDIELSKFYSELKSFNSVLDESLFDYEISKDVFDMLITQVNKNIPILQDYIKYQAIISNNTNFAYYDLFEDSNNDKQITIPQAIELIKSALKPMGKEYLKIVDKKFNDKSIDYLPNKDKNSGAYCMNCYNEKTLILTNFTDDYESVSTLCHEMGHCINAEYFNKAQLREDAEITPFAAEIASTVHEILLNLHMQKNEKDKAYYIHRFLEMVRSTIYRQTLFSEFELFAHSSIQEEEPISHLDLNKKYAELNKKYYGDSCILPEQLQYEWMRIPHFYRPYYVFSYATGLITAITIVQNILKDKEFVNKYIEFLKNGTNRPVIEVLKDIGIDLSSAKPYEDAFEFVKKQLDLYKTLSK